MSRLSNTFAVAIAGLALASGAVMAQAGQGTSAATRSAGPAPGAPAVLVPASQPDPMLNNGCWVQLMDNVDTPRSREYLTIVGAKYMPDLATASGKPWAGRSDGMSIGPHAQVTVYAEEDYGGRAVAIRPNTIVQDLRAKLGFVDSIASMKIDCATS